MAWLYKTPIYGADWSWAEFRSVLASMLWPERRCAELRAEVEDYIEKRYRAKPLLVNSGRSALDIALRRIRRKSPEKASIAVPSFICVCVVRKIVECGFQPSFFDLGPDASPCVSAAIRAIRPGTAAVLFPSLYGQLVDFSDLARECQSQKVFLIEDSAASFLLADRSGQSSGMTGDYAIFSFSTGKTIAAGSGGVLLDRTAPAAGQSDPVPDWGPGDQRRAAFSKIRFVLESVWPKLGYVVFRIRPARPGFVQRTYTIPRRIAAVDARIVLAQIQKWEWIHARKTAVAARYAKNLEGSSLSLPQHTAGSYLNRLFVKFPCIVRRMDGSHSRVVSELRKRGVQVQMPYYPAHRMPEYAPHAAGPLPLTDEFAQTMLQVPAHAAIRDEDIDAVSQHLLDCARACVN